MVRRGLAGGCARPPYYYFLFPFIKTKVCAFLIVVAPLLPLSNLISRPATASILLIIIILDGCSILKFIAHAITLHAVTCYYPLLHRPVVVVSGFHDPSIEGQFITYTCPHGFELTGPNASICTGNGEWEPDPRQVDCIGDYLQHLLVQYSNMS